MKNFIQPGEVISHAHTAIVTSGTPVKIGLLLGIASKDYAANEAGEYAISGVFEVAKLSTDVVAIGVQLYWDDGNSRLTTTASTHILAGRAFKAAGNGAATVQILLNSNG
jgi:predicted RecA/RadA family phage recombinase